MEYNASMGNMGELKSFFQNKKVLITGHTGFKGGWLTQTMLTFKANVIGIALEPNTDPNLFEILGLSTKIQNYFLDIRKLKDVKKIFQQEKPEIVFHLAAQPLVKCSYVDPVRTFETNIIGTMNILEAIREQGGVKSVVCVTSDKVYERRQNCPYTENDSLWGHDPYSASKVGAEIIIASYLKSFFLPIASARSGNVIGGGDWSRDRIVPDIVRSVFEQNTSVSLRNPDSVRPWQYILEPQYGYMLLAKSLYEGNKDFVGPWNFGPEPQHHISVQELTEKILQLLNRGSYTIDPDNTQSEAQSLLLDSSKAKGILGWNPALTLDEALGLTVDWYERFYQKANVIDTTNQQITLFFHGV